MKALITNEVLPRIQKQFKLPHIIHKTIATYGQGETSIAERIEGFENNLPPYIKLAYLPSFGRVRLRLSAKGTHKENLEKELDNKITELYQLIPEIITGLEDKNSLEKRVGELLKKANKTLATAESVTGGKIASSLVSVPGASAYFKGSIIAYTAETKINLLGVSKETINKQSVVSKEVAIEMARGVKEKLQTNYAVAVTGNAGPTSDHNNQGIGVVYIAFVSMIKRLFKNLILVNLERKLLIKQSINRLKFYEKKFFKNL